MTSPRLRVLLADDHALVRAGIRSLLEKIRGVEVVGEVSSGLEALAFVEKSPPDVLLVDIAMHGMNGLEVAARLSKDYQEVKVVILTMYANDEYIFHALRAGARGYLLKDAAASELELAMAAIARNETYLSQAISRDAIAGYLARVSTRGGGGPVTLTPRQEEILKRIADGESTKQIALALGLSVKTVETHRAQLMGRLGIYDVVGLVKYAIRVGLIPPVE